MNNSELSKSANSIRKVLLGMHFKAKSSHLGTGLSEIDILNFIYGKWITTEDKVILSKGHGASGLYATLNHYGILNDNLLETYYKDGSKLSAHPSPNALPEIPIATGSLGHGLSVASGIALGQKLNNSQGRIACILSDGECNEGSIWEAAIFAAHHKLNNLITIIDLNGSQGFGFTKDVLNMEPMADKWKAFGFNTLTIDGHNYSDLENAFKNAATSTLPTCIIAKTIKGKGISFMENRLEWHYLNLDQNQYNLALKELEA